LVPSELGIGYWRSHMVNYDEVGNYYCYKKSFHNCFANTYDLFLCLNRAPGNATGKPMKGRSSWRKLKG
jgi:hypothetical protein